jgi:putative hydrolase
MLTPISPPRDPGEIRLDEDWHVHSTFSDGRSSIQENVQAARVAGLNTLCLVDHVRADTVWVPRFVAETRRVALTGGLRVLCGVEAKMLDASGLLDVPHDHELADRLLIADHQLPTGEGPMDPAHARTLIESGGLCAGAVVEWLMLAYENALERHPGAILAHPFSLLAKMGLDASDLPRGAVAKLASVTARTGSQIEISERWRCPEPWVVRAFMSAGVEVLASTDSHEASTIGRYSHCRQLAATVREDLGGR